MAEIRPCSVPGRSGLGTGSRRRAAGCGGSGPADQIPGRAAGDEQQREAGEDQQRDAAPSSRCRRRGGDAFRCRQVSVGGSVAGGGSSSSEASRRGVLVRLLVVRGRIGPRGRRLARRAASPGARARCPPWRSSSRARRAAGSRSRRRSSGARRCRRCGRRRTSRRSPGGRRTGRRWRGAVATSSEANAASTKTARRARLDGWWRVAGVKVVAFRGAAPARCGQSCRVSRTALMPG